MKWQWTETKRSIKLESQLCIEQGWLSPFIELWTQGTIFPARLACGCDFILI